MPSWFVGLSRVISIVSFVILVIILFRKYLQSPIRYIANFFLSMTTQDNKSLIFPYIRTINAYNAYFNDEAYLMISVFFPTSVTHKQKFKLRARLTLDGDKSDWSSTEDILIVSNAVNRINMWKFPISETMLDKVKIHVQENIPMRATLHIEDFTDNNIFWDTEEWTTHFITKVN